MNMREKKAKRITGNQYQADPRQSLFLEYYLDRNSATFSNALQSALKAGYELEYAKTIKSQMPDWLSESIVDADLIKKAERNLKKFLDDEENPTIQADMTKFALKGLAKQKYSERTEITGKGGQAITIQAVQYGEIKELKKDEHDSNTS